MSSQNDDASEPRSSRVRFDDAMSSSRSSPIGTTRTEMSVTPASANPRQALEDGGLAPRDQDVTHVLASPCSSSFW